MINWFTYGGPMDISTEVASLLTSIFSVMMIFVFFGLFSWTVVKFYTARAQPTKTPHNTLMDAVRKHKGDQ